MSFIDELAIYLEAGRGGDGVVRWLHEKGKEYSGPAGGNAGKGGDIYAEAVRDIGFLSRYRAVKRLMAERGEDGGSGGRHGRSGKDLILKLPVGSVITNLRTRRHFELMKEGERVLLVSGGRGGLGNKHFKSSVNTKPTERTLGERGERADFFIELRLIADAGLVGLPNAGKSSLLNVLTAAGAKVGAYPFTTLEPNLGDFYGFVIADIPGLVEGASEGRGLGHKFLRHIKRTKLILHCLSVEADDLRRSYEIVRRELQKYDPALAEKPELLLLTKSDLSGEKTLQGQLAAARKLNRNAYAVSVYDDKSVKRLGDELAKLLHSFY